MNLTMAPDPIKVSIASPTSPRAPFKQERCRRW